jgi:hypothetical protein
LFLTSWRRYYVQVGGEKLQTTSLMITLRPFLLIVEELAQIVAFLPFLSSL